MNTAMGKLAEKLGIDHARMPREELAEVVCEKALEALEEEETDLYTLKLFLKNGKARALAKKRLFIAHRIETALIFIKQYELFKARK